MHVSYRAVELRSRARKISGWSRLLEQFNIRTSVDLGRAQCLVPENRRLFLDLSLVQPFFQVLDFTSICIERTLFISDGFVGPLLLQHHFSNILDIFVEVAHEELAAHVSNYGEEIVLADVAVAIHIVEIKGNLFQGKKVRVIVQLVAARKATVLNHKVILMVEVFII